MIRYFINIRWMNDQSKRWIYLSPLSLASYSYPKDEVVFLNLEDRFLNAEGKINTELFTDGTHLTPAGYATMADALVPHIERLIKMGPIKTSD